MDHADPHFFTETDIQRLLITAAKNLEDTDTYRHERFREYEMRKAIKRENFLSHLTPAERADAERNEKVKHRNWRKANPMAHPGSARHFMNVWRNYDGMTDDFNARTFFKLHDTNSDYYWDVAEVEFLMRQEAQKFYDPEHDKDDKIELEEEVLRMREHVMEEMDNDPEDKMISENEFKTFTESIHFKAPSEEDHYESVKELVENGKQFTVDELNAYKYKIGRYELDIAIKLNKLEQLNIDSRRNRELLANDRERSMSKEVQDIFDHREEEIHRAEKLAQQLNNDIKKMKNNLKSMQEGFNHAKVAGTSFDVYDQYRKANHLQILEDMAHTFHEDL